MDKAVDAIMNHFGRYVVDCDKHWPRCPFHGSEMCQVIKRGENIFFECFEFNDENKICGHREFSV